jgi:hypothetical protein
VSRYSSVGYLCFIYTLKRIQKLLKLSKKFGHVQNYFSGIGNIAEVENKMCPHLEPRLMKRKSAEYYLHCDFFEHTYFSAKKTFRGCIGGGGGEDGRTHRPWDASFEKNGDVMSQGRIDLGPSFLHVLSCTTDGVLIYIMVWWSKLAIVFVPLPRKVLLHIGA